MLPRINSILNISNNFVLCQWTTGEKRRINFVKLVENYPIHLKDKILKLEVIETIRLNKESKTLYIPNLVNSLTGDLDFCPDMLYYTSELVS